MNKEQKKQLVRYLTLHLREKEEALRLAKYRLRYSASEVRRLRRSYSNMGKEAASFPKGSSVSQQAIALLNENMRRDMISKVNNSRTAKEYQKKVRDLKMEWLEVSNYIFWLNRSRNQK